MKRCGDALYRFSKTKRKRGFNVAATLWSSRITSAATAKHLAKQVAKAFAAEIVLVESKTASTATK
jgi:hypothetical protein